jgi:hypothetical protein
MSVGLSDESGTIDLAVKTASKIFGVCLDVVEEEDPDLITGPSFYDFARDRVCLCPSFIKRYCKEHDYSQASVITYAICHEMGHASETRSFEQGLLFPYGFNISGKLPTRMRSRFGISLYQQDLEVAMRQVLNSVLDYCVDRKLDASGMKDVTQKNIISQAKSELHERKSGNYKEGLYKFNALTRLPLRVVSYRFGDFNQTERAILEECYQYDGLLDKWQVGQEILESCELGNVNRLIDTVAKTYYEIFGIVASVESTRREMVEKKYVGGRLPDFWRAGQYFVFSLS